MPQPLLDVFQLPSVVVENARRAVTDIVETHLRQSMLCENLLECTGDLIRAIGLAVAPDKDINSIHLKEFPMKSYQVRSLMDKVITEAVLGCMLI